ncbi:DEAD/DEAH box helicase family protein [Aetokthonos hydrillicola Thurmond2011]|uniref:DEAD/DEAH box helicase family protein n=1 Tax=Aetokthonos hydrillicola Thurmond2011 TaxID=2712845 RepID=A0AAP5IGC0_9CYAN|nr:helicase-related protein [Aetokthonos hydrillicola]MBO3462402.1 DEAD/DEAH box helicase family protein [Aetokthonos hydrillicola CCALA 1050]MBW4590610.1 DEAD/DEAH box helicase family protein [Aetokthonos hydrillicola CCALA 1050]MDR9900382.1 DEAD/DEAH box helicase family protein [Aetokthonos hydrillicola Thurmond2011]
MTNLLAGTEVEARSLRWEVVSVTQLGQQTLYRLRCLEGELRGEEFDILYPFESVTPVIRDLRPDKAAPLPNWLVYHQGFLLEQALGSDALVAVQPGRLRLEAYQLVPVLRALRMSRVRLLLADGVGLGKTIQAGLIITELMARRVAHRILIVCPAGPLLEQWKLEMAERFGLRMDEVNRGKLEEIRRGTELGANPFDYIALGIASIDFLKQEKILELLERANYDMVVLDEAHHCMDLGAVEERDDSQRRRLAEVLARRCDSLLLLTATPHDGNDRSFASLCELLDLSLVDGRGNLRGERYRSYVVRRLKSHIPDRFKSRIVEPKPVFVNQEHRDYMALQQGLLELLAPELRKAFRKKRYSDVLAFLALLKRSVSTVEACKTTLTVVAERFQQLLTEGSETQESRRQRLKTLREYYRKLERFGTVSFEEEQEQFTLETEELAQKLAELQREVGSESRSLSKISSLVEALDNLIELADAASDQDPKLQQLVQEIQDIRTHHPQSNVLVYTEYTTSQRAAAKALAAAKIETILTLSGNDGEKVRLEITERFRSESNLVLISTDTAAEGLNLQQRCHHLIHLELPFNPNRLEQRNGRIDRYGQEYDPVVRYLFLRGTFEERILLRLIAKYERQRASLTFVPNTLGLTTSSDASAARLLQGLMEEDQKLFKDDTPLLVNFDSQEDDNAATDAATQELLEEIDRSLKGFQQTSRTYPWLGDAGLNAEQRLLTQADVAREKGKSSSGVDLFGFVRDAVLLDGGDFVSTQNPDIFTVHLPWSWSYGLDELPGYEADTRCLRLTVNIDITRDEQNRPVGFLGRAHPLVRRALDRVRNLSFGGADNNTQDSRVSAVKADVKKPTLLFTFLGRVASGTGSEFERVLAVKVSSDGETEFYDQAQDWLNLADPKQAIRTKDVWKNNFEQSWEIARQQAQNVVKRGWLPLAEGFIQERSQELEIEKARQAEWLQQRSQEITGTDVEIVRQLSLFDTLASTQQSLPESNWRSLSDPKQRLAGFATDTAQSVRSRSEADGVLRIYGQRVKMLESKLALQTPEVLPLGVLMLLP